MDNLRTWFDDYREDIKRIFKLFTPLVLMVIIIWKLPFLLNQMERTRLDSKTLGVVESIEKIKGINESEEGGKVIIQTYRINYKYETEEDEVTCTEYISRERLKLKERMKLNRIEKGDSIMIGFDSKGKRRSKIIIE